jgi:ubiquinone/menaquinone biosynthesis C-methylase UbiE
MSFDRLAPHYRWMEFVLAGEKLQRCRTAFLDRIPAARNILLVGEGHGRCLVECRSRFPNARITCVDSSEQMLAQARRRLKRCHPGSGLVEFVQADVLDSPTLAKLCDLIVTHFFLDCFRADQLEQVISRLAATATSEAHWLIADFQNAPAGMRRIRSRLILWTMYAFFRTMTRLPARQLTSPGPCLEGAGFSLHARVETEWGLLHSDWWRRGTDMPVRSRESE